MWHALACWKTNVGALAAAAVSMLSSACGYRLPAVNEFIDRNPGISSTVAYGLERSCPVVGTPVSGMRAAWGEPTTTRRGEPDSVRWERPGGVVVTAAAKEGIVTDIEVMVPGGIEALAERAELPPARAYLREHPHTDADIAYSITVGCPAVGMDQSQLRSALGTRVRSVVPEVAVSGVSRFVMGIEGQSFVIEFISGRVAAWAYCPGAGGPYGTPDPLCRRAFR